MNIPYACSLNWNFSNIMIIVFSLKIIIKVTHINNQIDRTYSSHIIKIFQMLKLMTH